MDDLPWGHLPAAAGEVEQVFRTNIRIALWWMTGGGSSSESRRPRVPGFTHLHTVSGFSMRYGGSHPERLAERAAERGMDALALTDRDTLAGAVRFAKASAKAGIRPLFGVDLAVATAPSPAVPPAVPPAGSPAVSPAGQHGEGPAGAGEASYRRRNPVKGVPSSTSPLRARSSWPATGPPGGPSCAGWSPPPTRIPEPEPEPEPESEPAGRCCPGAPCAERASSSCSAPAPRWGGRSPRAAPTGPPGCSHPGGRSTATPCAWRPSTTAAPVPDPARSGWPPVPSASPPSRASRPC